MWDNRNRILNWIKQGAIKSTDGNLAMLHGQGVQTKAQWAAFLQLMMLWLAVIALCSGVIFFFAYNWQDMSRFTKFGLVEAAMVISCIGYVRFSFNPHLKTALLMAMSLLTGALLAVVGQTYQTGADPWQLFAVWSVFMLPWALLSRSCIVWIFWVGIVNVALGLYLDLSRHFLWFSLRSIDSAIVITLINSALLVLFELVNQGDKLAPQRFTSPYLANRYTQQVIVTIAGFAISFWASEKAFRSSDEENRLMYYVIWLVAIVAFYRFIIKDFYIIAASCLSFIIVSSMFLFEAVEHSADDGAFLLISFYIIASSSLATYWLKRLPAQLEESSVQKAEEKAL